MRAQCHWYSVGIVSTVTCNCLKVVAWESDILTARVHEKIQVSTCEIRSVLQGRGNRISTLLLTVILQCSSRTGILSCAKLIFDFMVTICLFFHYRDHTVDYQRKRCQARLRLVRSTDFKKKQMIRKSCDFVK